MMMTMSSNYKSVVVKQEEEETYNKEEVEEKAELWSNQLPGDVLGLIRERLLAVELCMFRSVCKAWRGLTIEKSGLDLAVRRKSTDEDVMITRRFPVVMKVHKDYCSFFHPIYNTTVRRVIPELANAILFHAKGEWVLVARKRERGKSNTAAIFFFNISTMVRIDVPSLPTNIGFLFHRMCFFSNPESTDWSIIAMDCGYNLGTIKYGQPSWNFSCVDPFYCETRTNPVVVNQGLLCCYTLGIDGTLFSFDPSEISLGPKTSLRTVSHQPPPIQENINSSGRRDVEIDECFLVPVEEEKDVLLTIFKHKEADDHRDTFLTSVYEFNLVTNKWRKLNTLGSRMLFVARTGSILLQVEEEEDEASTMMINMLKNKVYYPNMRMDNDVFFSLATGSEHCFLLNLLNSSSSYGRRNVANMHNCLSSNSAWVGPMPHLFFFPS